MNYYTLLDIFIDANLLDICNSFQKKCLNNPQNIFLYTKALATLINPTKRIIYDANTLKINLPLLIKNYHIYEEYQNIAEFELLNFIEWLNYFKDFFYDIKYHTNNKRFLNLIELWYNRVENILEELKNYVKSIYLI